MDPTPSIMSTIITNVGLWVTASVSWITTSIGAFTTSGNEYLLVPFYVGLVGIGFGLIRRAIKCFR